MRIFQIDFDVPYPFSKFDQIFVPEKRGGMENAGIVALPEDSLARGKVKTFKDQVSTATLITHEMVH